MGEMADFALETIAKAEEFRLEYKTGRSSYISEEDFENETGIPFNNVHVSLQCPICHNILVERTGPYGKFLGCSKFPGCKGSKKTTAIRF